MERLHLYKKPMPKYQVRGVVMTESPIVNLS